MHSCRSLWELLIVKTWPETLVLRTLHAEFTCRTLFAFILTINKIIVLDTYDVNFLFILAFLFPSLSVFFSPCLFQFFCVSLLPCFIWVSGLFRFSFISLGFLKIIFVLPFLLLLVNFVVLFQLLEGLDSGHFSQIFSILFVLILFAVAHYALLFELLVSQDFIYIYIYTTVLVLWTLYVYTLSHTTFKICIPVHQNCIQCLLVFKCPVCL